MKKILFIVQSCYGNIYPLLEIVKRLEKRNFEMYIYTTRQYISMFKGTTVHCFEEQEMQIGEIQEANSIYDGNLFHYLFTSTVESINISNVLIDKLQKRIHLISPDIIIHDCFSYIAKLLAERFCIPAINVVPSYALNNSIIEKMPKHFCEMFTNENYNPQKYSQMLSKMRKIENMLKRKYQYPYSLLEANTCEEDINICFSIEKLNYFSGSFNKSYYFVGRPMDRIKKKSTMLSKNDKIRVYISSGTLYDYSLEFYQKCINKLSTKKYEVIIITKEEKVNELRKNAPNNINIFSHVNQKEVLSNCHIFISHGGNNSFYESIVNRVPTLYIPIIGDQMLVAKTAQKYGVGTYFSYEQINNINMEEEIELMLKNTSMDVKLYQYQQAVEEITNLNLLDEVIDKICKL